MRQEHCHHFPSRGQCRSTSPQHKTQGVTPTHGSLICPVQNNVATEPSRIFATRTGQKWVLQMRGGVMSFPADAISPGSSSTDVAKPGANCPHYSPGVFGPGRLHRGSAWAPSVLNCQAEWLCNVASVWHKLSCHFFGSECREAIFLYCNI